MFSVLKREKVKRKRDLTKSVSTRCLTAIVLDTRLTIIFIIKGTNNIVDDSYLVAGEMFLGPSPSVLLSGQETIIQRSLNPNGQYDETSALLSDCLLPNSLPWKKKKQSNSISISDSRHNHSILS